jgi:anti-sigma factor RsiW
MPSILTCPDEAELLAVAAGDEVSDDVRRHLEQCPRCPELVQHYRSLVAVLRNGEPGASLSPPTAQ